MGLSLSSSGLCFKRLDDEVIDLLIPDNWNIDHYSSSMIGEYSVSFVVSNAPPAESALGTLAVDNGETAGFLIPGSAILSSDSPHCKNAFYCAAALIVAEVICQNSRQNDFTLASPESQTANSSSMVFRDNGFYLVLWNKKISPLHSLDNAMRLALCSYGLIVPEDNRLPILLPTAFAGNNDKVKVKSGAVHPDYIVKVACSLIPYCDNPFLRFFYIYQLIEYLMGVEFDEMTKEIRGQLVSKADLSLVAIRELLGEYSQSAIEKTRINKVLHKACPSTELSLVALLDSVGMNDPRKAFAQQVYSVRNLLFHSFEQVHEKENKMDAICRNLYPYVMDLFIA